MQHASPEVERLLIGNKCDWEQRRVVPRDQGEMLARQQDITFMETSAKTNHNINEAFDALAKLILKRVREIHVLYNVCIYMYIVHVVIHCVSVHVQYMYYSIVIIPLLLKFSTNSLNFANSVLF